MPQPQTHNPTAATSSPVRGADVISLRNTDPDLYQDLRALAAMMPENYREIFTLRHGLGGPMHSLAEIADITGSTPGRVRSRLEVCLWNCHRAGQLRDEELSGIRRLLGPDRNQWAPEHGHKPHGVTKSPHASRKPGSYSRSAGWTFRRSNRSSVNRPCKLAYSQPTRGGRRSHDVSVQSTPNRHSTGSLNTRSGPPHHRHHGNQTRSARSARSTTNGPRRPTLVTSIARSSTGWSCTSRPLSTRSSVTSTLTNESSN
jgi:hypothetical protein